jgi:hypothetical protein
MRWLERKVTSVSCDAWRLSLLTGNVTAEMSQRREVAGRQGRRAKHRGPTVNGCHGSVGLGLHMPGFDVIMSRDVARPVEGLLT